MAPSKSTNLFFLTPLSVADNETKRVRINLERQYDDYTFIVSSGRETAPLEHVRGRVRRTSLPTPAAIDPAAIKARCQQGQVEYGAMGQETQQERFLDFGPRWKNLRSVQYGDAEAIAFLELPVAFQDETTIYQLHPALLDLATSAGLPLVPDYADSNDFYVPLSYGTLTIAPAGFPHHLQPRPLPDRQ